MVSGGCRWPEECQPVSLNTNQMLPAQRIKFKKPKTWVGRRGDRHPVAAVSRYLPCIVLGEVKAAPSTSFSSNLLEDFLRNSPPLTVAHKVFVFYFVSKKRLSFQAKIIFLLFENKLV